MRKIALCIVDSIYTLLYYLAAARNWVITKALLCTLWVLWQAHSILTRKDK